MLKLLQDMDQNKEDIQDLFIHYIDHHKILSNIYIYKLKKYFFFINRYFLSVGDWSAKIWVEDLKMPIIRTKYHGSYLADGCWSPTRLGAFFLARRVYLLLYLLSKINFIFSQDGWLDVWDYYYRQNEVAFSHKVSDSPLTCMKIN